MSILDQLRGAGAAMRGEVKRPISSLVSQQKNTMADRLGKIGQIGAATRPMAPPPPARPMAPLAPPPAPQMLNPSPMPISRPSMPAAPVMGGGGMGAVGGNQLDMYKRKQFMNNSNRMAGGGGIAGPSAPMTAGRGDSGF